jgi:hypothetical protein
MHSLQRCPAEGSLARRDPKHYLRFEPTDAASPTGRAPSRQFEVIMFAFFRRRRAARRYVWSPAVDFSDRRIAATLMTFSKD